MPQSTPGDNAPTIQCPLQVFAMVAMNCSDSMHIIIQFRPHESNRIQVARLSIAYVLVISIVVKLGMRLAECIPDARLVRVLPFVNSRRPWKVAIGTKPL